MVRIAGRQVKNDARGVNGYREADRPGGGRSASLLVTGDPADDDSEAARCRTAGGTVLGRTSEPRADRMRLLGENARHFVCTQRVPRTAGCGTVEAPMDSRWTPPGIARTLPNYRNG